jgi:Caspase domain
MKNSAISVQSSKIPSVDLSGTGQVVAIVVGIEHYQQRGSGDTLPTVAFARNDAEAFSDVLRSIYPVEKLSVRLLRDSDATCTRLRDELLYTIKSLAPEDLFIFYYAGHGFYGAGGNRVTAWDTNLFNVEGTTLLLREVLSDPLAASVCQRAVAFVDACATGFAKLGQGRDVVATMNSQELEQFLSAATYSAMFLSCKPGEQSYPSRTLKHGIWTHFLLKALKGDADEALGPERYLTDTSLRDYLRLEVPRYITRETQIHGNQTPQALINASNTFAIRHVPPRIVPIAAAGDLSQVQAPIVREYLESVQSRPISSLNKFDKGRGHSVPKAVTFNTKKFVRNLLASEIDEEIQERYQAIKTTFKLRSADVPHSSGDGQGSIDTQFFRFSIDTRQDDEDASQYVIVRKLELRDTPDPHLEKIDEVFGSMFEEVVIEVDAPSLDFDHIVSLFENVAEAHGGAVEDEQNSGRVTYRADDGTQIQIDTLQGRISLGGGVRQTSSRLLARARQYRFGLTGQSRLLLT